MRKILSKYLYPLSRELDELKLQQASSHFHRVDYSSPDKQLADYEYRVFSQWGDDGIIQYLVSNLVLGEKVFVEFGVEDFLESNCRFLLTYSNWSGLVIDGSEEFVRRIIGRSDHWRHDLSARAAFLSVDNINAELRAGLKGRDPDLISIDVDGVDYWLFEEIDYTPAIFIIEYNAVFGAERAITVPYRADFDRTRAHYSNLYFGASLAALEHMARRKGYSLVGCNSAGNNAYFVRDDLLADSVLQAQSVDSAYVSSRFRESRDQQGRLSYLSGQERLECIRGLPVFNCATGALEEL